MSRIGNKFRIGLKTKKHVHDEQNRRLECSLPRFKALFGIITSPTTLYRRRRFDCEKFLTVIRAQSSAPPCLEARPKRSWGGRQTTYLLILQTALRQMLRSSERLQDRSPLIGDPRDTHSEVDSFHNSSAIETVMSTLDNNRSSPDE